MSNNVTLIISCLALIVSGLTAWLTFFRKGRLVMTQPTTIFFGRDGPNMDQDKVKVYLRTLLYCTAKRGFVMESLFLSISRNETKQNFNVWVYGNKGDLNRGSGLFVPPEGITFDHHFLQPDDGSDFKFIAGSYNLKVFAVTVGKSTPEELLQVNLTVSEKHAAQLEKPRTGLFFDWGPDQKKYQPLLKTRGIDLLEIQTQMLSGHHESV